MTASPWHRITAQLHRRAWETVELYVEQRPDRWWRCGAVVAGVCVPCEGWASTSLITAKRHAVYWWQRRP